MKVSDEHSETIRPNMAPQTPREHKPGSPVSVSKNLQTRTGQPAAVVQLSGRSQDLKRAKEAALATSDVGEKKVADLKKKLQTGAYKVDPQRIAAKILEGK